MDKIYKNVQIEQEYHELLKVVAESEHNSMTNVVEKLIAEKAATVTVPVVGTIEPSGRVVIADHRRMIAKQGIDGIPTAACLSPEEFEILTDETTRE